MALSATERVRHIRAQAGQRNMSLYSPTVCVANKNKSLLAKTLKCYLTADAYFER